MKIVTSPSEMKNLSTTYRKAGKTVGLVPTMGALHAGHVSLLAECRRQSDVVVMSIFVNPIQFGPAEDFSKYPRPFDADCRMAEQNGCDVVFAPEPGAMYPADFSTFVNVEKITDTLCGASRPGHFKGVATVVLKLFNIVSPKIAIFGLKDALQCIIIKRMVEDLNVGVELEFAPTVRDPDGLAMSSRNSYLTSDERDKAACIQAGLTHAKMLFESGERNAARLRAAMLDIYKNVDAFTVEYVEIVDPRNAEELVKIDHAALIAVAVRTTKTRTRLIDNVILGGSI